MGKEMELVGKTIVFAEIRKLPIDPVLGSEYDDEPILFLRMSDGSEFSIVASYGGYTGKSEDEYPRFIEVNRG